MRDLLRNLTAMLRSGRLVILHLVGNAVLLTAAALWLLIGEAHIYQLVFAVVAALAIIFGALWLHTSTLEFSAAPQPANFRAAFRPSPLRMLWMLLGCAILFSLMWYASGWQDHEWQVGGYLYAKAPHFLRPTRGEVVYNQWLHRIFVTIQWYVLPALLLPLLAARVIGARVRTGFKVLIRWKYWLVLALLVALGVWLPQVVMEWTPGKKLSAESASLAVRLAVAYAIAVAAWLCTAGLLGYFIRMNDAGVGGQPVA